MNPAALKKADDGSFSFPILRRTRVFYIPQNFGTPETWQAKLNPDDTLYENFFIPVHAWDGEIKIEVF